MVIDIGQTGEEMSKGKVGIRDRDKERGRASGALPDVGSIVGGNLKRLRKRQGYSLDRLARLSGVSRAMLGQIETGKSVPTINLLWKVAHALGVSLVNLITGPNPFSTVLLPRENAKILTSSGGRFTCRALFPLDGERRVEFYELRIAPRHRERADAHPAGTRENLVVAKGTIEVVTGEERAVVLSEGDALFFGADVPHSYANPGQEEAVAFLVMSHMGSYGP
jgi:transcriptional regulator with XRE-family HTH domain